MPSKHAVNEDVELEYNSHLRDIQRSDKDGESSVLEQDEREIRRMGKVSLYKVYIHNTTVQG
jgi:hypothetical protein